MRKNQNVRLGLTALVAAWASFSAVGAGTPTSGDLFFTRWQGGAGPRVAKVPFNYDGTTATLGAEVPIVQNNTRFRCHYDACGDAFNVKRNHQNRTPIEDVEPLCSNG